MAHAVKGAMRRLYQPMRYMCNFPKNTALFEYKKPDTDLLFSNLKNASSTKSVLDIVAVHSGIMNNKHIMQALRSLFVLQKHGNSNLSTHELLGHRDFKKLCRQLRTQAGAIELNDTIEALKVVSYVGVPSDSVIVQVLLQMIRHHINSLSLPQIIFLDFLLGQFKESPLVDALKIALPIVFEIHLPVKMDYESATHLAEYLFYISRNPMKFESLQRVVNALLTYEDFDAKTAKSLVWSVCDMEGNEIFKPLLKKAITSLVVHVDELSFSDMETTLSKLISRYNKKSTYFYDETFYDTVANYVIDRNMGFKQSVYILRKLGRVNHFHKLLLDYMAKKIHQNPDIASNIDPVDIYSITLATSMTDYRPPYWEEVSKLIANSGNIAQTASPKEIIWIKFGASLCLLNIFKIDVLTRCLEEKYLQFLFKRKFASDFDNYVTIWQCIQMFKPDFNCLLMDKFAPATVVTLFQQPIEFPLEAALHKALGGDKYVMTNLYSKAGTQIDHVVIYRKGGYPVAITTEQPTFIEDLELQPECQLVVILGLRHFHYTLNHSILRNSVTLAIKNLESKGYQVVPVSLDTWEGLPEFEKIPYLMRGIKDRTDSDLTAHSAV